MAETYGDSDKDQFVVAFGESDGGHSFVTLSDAIDAKKIKSVQPQDDVWGAIDSLRNGSAQIAVIPFSNKITSADPATVAGLASGDLKVLGQIQRRTNHVLVGLKHNINRVEQAAVISGYAEKSMSATDGHSPKRAPSAASAPTEDAIKQFVFLLRMVYSSKTVFDQTRGKLTGSDFRSAITVEHTSNPMRVLLRDHRTRQTQAIVSTLDNWTAAPVAKPGHQEIDLGKKAGAENPIEEKFFSAALVAEGLLDSANRVCGVGPGLKPNKLCTQRLSEITEHLVELQTDAEAPHDLPNNVTTFLVVQAANAKLSDGLKKKFPWESGEARMAAHRSGIEEEIRSFQNKINRYQAGIDSSAKQLEETTEPLKAAEIKEHIARLESEKAAVGKEVAALRDHLVNLADRKLGPSTADPSYRVAFLLSVDGADADWSKTFKTFETKMGDKFKGWKLKFDQSPELTQHLGKSVLLVSARGLGITKENAAKVEADIARHFKQQKEADSKVASGLALLADQAAGGPPKKVEAKLLGVYPSWVVSGAERDLWAAEGYSPQKEAAAALKRTVNAMGVVFFVLFWMLVIFLVTVTSTPYGRTWAMGLLDNFFSYFRYLFLGPG